MKPKESTLLSLAFIAAWTGLWLTGPENPGDTYGRGDWMFFWAGIIGAIIWTVRSYSRYVQERDAAKLKKVLKRRDARPNR